MLCCNETGSIIKNCNYGPDKVLLFFSTMRESLQFMLQNIMCSLIIVNAEDVRREDNELQSASHHVVTLDGEVMAVNGKLLAGHMVSLNATDAADQVSVCSCTCLAHRHHNHLNSSNRSSPSPKVSGCHRFLSICPGSRSRPMPMRAHKNSRLRNPSTGLALLGSGSHIKRASV